MDGWYEQTFNVTLEELGQDAIGGQLMKNAAEELLCYSCNIPWDQHTAKHQRTTTVDSQSHSMTVYKPYIRMCCKYDSFGVSYLSAWPEKLALDANLKEAD